MAVTCSFNGDLQLVGDHFVGMTGRDFSQDLLLSRRQSADPLLAELLQWLKDVGVSNGSFPTGPFATGPFATGPIVTGPIAVGQLLQGSERVRL